MLRSKLRFGFVSDASILKVTRSGLKDSGLAMGTVVARAVEPSQGQLAGVVVKLDGGAPEDKTPIQDFKVNPVSAGDTLYNFYSLEVVQRIGYDSFTPDNGVLIAKNLDEERRGRGGFHPFTWVIDAHPEDIRMLDFKRPNGEPVMRTVADYRQLNDALFHSGLDSGSEFEWEDQPNRLHFYVVDAHKDAQGILSYRVAVRSLDGSGPQTRGVSIASAVAQTAGACTFTLKNTGTSAAADPYLDNDLYRLSVSVEGRGWSAQLQNALAGLKFGASQSVPVTVKRSAAAASSARITLVAVSESDPTKGATGTCTVPPPVSKR
jgi:hypothetical protein